jgi:hypothetical protein
MWFMSDFPSEYGASNICGSHSSFQSTASVAEPCSISDEVEWHAISSRAVV